MDNLLKQLRAGLELVENLTPLSGLLGDKAAAVGKIVDGLTDLAKTVLDRIEDGAIGFTSEDQAEIRAINERLAVLNDDLARRIADS